MSFILNSLYLLYWIPFSVTKSGQSYEKNMKEEKEKPKIFILYRKNVALGKKTSREFAYFAILLYFCRTF